MRRTDLPALRQKASALVAQMRDGIARLDLVRPQVAVSLYRRRVRCGKSSCHCARGPGHLVWALNFRDSGGQHGRSVSSAEARSLQPRVEAYRRYRKLRALLARQGRVVLILVDRMQRPLVRRYRPEAKR